jgi:hypothetical protein
MNDLIDQMVNAFRQSIDDGDLGIGDDVVDAVEYSRDVFLDNAAILEEIAQLYYDGELTEDEFEDELEDQRQALATQLLALVVIEKVALQKAIDGALDILRQSVRF